MEEILIICMVAVFLYLLGKLIYVFRNVSQKTEKIKPNHVFRNISQGAEKLKPKLPGKSYRLIYSDQKITQRQEGVIYGTLLKSESLSITGKPDYIYQGIDKTPLPVEIKSGEIGEQKEPYNGDLMQLAAYFAIIEENFEKKPAIGYIIYRDCMFKIKNSKALRKELTKTLRDMRTMLKDGEEEPASNCTACRYCICRGTVCEFSE